jgi:hypothetical protein
MSSFADRSRERLMQQLDGDPRLEKAKVLSATPLIRGSVVMLMISGIVGALILQVIFGSGGFPFAIGLVLGYTAYIVFKLYTMGPPKVIAVMAALTRNKLILLGSRRVGIAAEWDRKSIEDIDLLRRGNLFIMGKIAIRVSGEKPVKFFLSNRKIGQHFVDTFHKSRKR